MKSLLTGILIAACLVPLDAYGSHCRKRFVVRKQVVQKVVVQKVIQQVVQPVVYQQPPLLQVQAAALQPVYVQQQQAVAAVCCCPCPPYAHPPQHPIPAPLPPGRPGGGDPPAPPPAGDVPAPGSPDDDAIQTLVNKACIQCHKGDNPKTSLDLRDVKLLTGEQCKDMALRVMLGEMPPKNPEAVSDVEAQQLTQWAKGK